MNKFLLLLLFTLTANAQIINVGKPGSTGGGAVSSVNGSTGAVVLTASSVGAEPAISSGTSLQYWRGDKTFQTLNSAAVPELTNLYFTNARAIAATLTGYTSGAGTISATDSLLAAIQKLNGNDALKEAALGNPAADGYALISTAAGVRSWAARITDNISEGATNLYFTTSRVLSTALTGLSTATSTVVSTTDSIVVAIGKLQAQVTGRALTADIQTFTASGTWTKPAGAKTVEVIVLGGGGGGSSGRMDAAGTIRCGGSGGATGGMSRLVFQASSLGTTEAVTVGAGGTGGAGRTTLGDGNPGLSGGSSTFGTWLKGLGGQGAFGGTATTAVAGGVINATSGAFHYAQRGGSAASATGTNAAGVGATDATPTGGGGGGGLTAANVVGVGAAGGAIGSNLADVLATAGGLAGVGAANAGNGNNATWLFGMQIGTGGGGANAVASGVGGNGGNGGKGAGGGGAGACTTGGTCGTGGTGGSGWVIVVTYF